MSDNLRISVAHLKNTNQVMFTIHTDKVSSAITLSPEEACAIGDMGELARVYRDINE